MQGCDCMEDVRCRAYFEQPISFPHINFVYSIFAITLQQSASEFPTVERFQPQISLITDLTLQMGGTVDFSVHLRRLQRIC